MTMQSTRTVVLAFLAAATVWLPSTAAAQIPLKPNLRAFPASNLSVGTNGFTGVLELRFATTSWNSGDGPLELRAGAVVDGGQQVFQWIYDSQGGHEERLAGTFTYDGAHQHFHFDDYALYRLAPVNASGAGTASKRTFCIIDTTKVDTRLAGAPRKAVYTTCNPTVQGMSVGWGDTYNEGLPGQSIDLTGLSDGLYELTITIDPLNLLTETNDNDNSACSLIQLSITNQTVQEVGACGATGPDVTITSLSPVTGWVGTTFPIEIIGTNFTPAIAVGFENGSGPAPVATDVIVHDATRITAVVTIKNGGRSTDPWWDLRVGSAVKPNAFQVLRN